MRESRMREKADAGRGMGVRSSWPVDLHKLPCSLHLFRSTLGLVTEMKPHNLLNPSIHRSAFPEVSLVPLKCFHHAPHSALAKS